MKILSVVAVVVLALTFGVAYADQMPLDREKEVSAYIGVVSPKLDTGFTGAAAGGLREEEMEHGYSIIDDLSPAGFHKEAWGVIKSEAGGVKGVAAGGMRSEELGYSFIDTLSPTGVSRDLP
ncbi:MAG TPA: hypothetical protein VN604_03850 [Nitrospirota bacterium]|nr:hypothetical protein [Nitrospirota bacterium]